MDGLKFRGGGLIIGIKLRECLELPFLFKMNCNPA